MAEGGMDEEDPYRPPRSIGRMPAGLSVLKVLFSFRGRIPRSTYWIYSLPVNGLIALLFQRIKVLAEAREPVSGSSALPPLAPAGDGPLVPWEVVVLLLCYLPLLWMKLAVLAKRWHDQNRSANWLLVSFVPLVGMVINFLECGCNPGTRGENRYGADPVPDERQRKMRAPRRGRGI
jgi:uncharacterized membrane protein YhaH (DUF805 family)